MVALTMTPADLTPFAKTPIPEAKAQAMIDDALAIAATVAPCILTEDFAYAAAAKAYLREAILRWHDAGTGAVTQVTTGPFSQTTDDRSPRRGMFWPSEITGLQRLCASGNGGAFTIDTIPQGRQIHADICALNFGALYCSCGAVLTNLFPLYEV